MQSPVSGLLREPLSANAQSAIFVPWIRASLAAAVPLLTRINLAHLVALRAAGLLSSAHAISLRQAIEQIGTMSIAAMPGEVAGRARKPFAPRWSAPPAHRTR